MTFQSLSKVEVNFGHKLSLGIVFINRYLDRDNENTTWVFYDFWIEL